MYSKMCISKHNIMQQCTDENVKITTSVDFV